MEAFGTRWVKCFHDAPLPHRVAPGLRKSSDLSPDFLPLTPTPQPKKREGGRSWAGSLCEQPHLVIIAQLPVVPSMSFFFFKICPPQTIQACACKALQNHFGGHFHDDFLPPGCIWTAHVGISRFEPLSSQTQVRVTQAGDPVFLWKTRQVQSELKAYLQQTRLAAKRLPLHTGNDICKLCNVNVLAKLCLISYPDKAHEKPAFL